MAGDILQIEPSHRGKAPPIAGLSLGRLLAVGILLSLGLWLHGLVGLLLLLAGTDLAMSRQPFTPRPVCWPALGFAAAGMLLIDPVVAFAYGWLVEISCDPALAAVLTSAGGEPTKGHQ